MSRGKKVLLSLVAVWISVVIVRVVMKPKVVEIDPSRYHWIDRFEDEEFNMVGGKRFHELAPFAQMNVSFHKEKLPEQEKANTVLKIDYKIPQDRFARMGIEFNGLDISKAEVLSFKVKGAKGGEFLRLLIVDRDGHKNDLQIDKHVPITTEWKVIDFPVSDFPDINFGGVEYMLFDFTSPDKSASESTLYLDDIRFFGSEKNLFSRSLMDNIAGFPEQLVASQKRIDELLAIEDNREFIQEVAKDTWIFFRDIVDNNNHLVLDYIDVQRARVGDFTSVTNIGLYLMCVISAYDMGFLPKQVAIDRIQNTLEVMGTIPRWHGLWYNFYSTTNAQVTRNYISSVDNGWLATGFMVARNTFDEVKELCTKYLEGMNFSVLYNSSLGHINLGYDFDEQAFSPYHYGLLCTEPRVTSMLAMGKGNIPKDHWFRVYRTLPRDWDWQAKTPEGDMSEALGVQYFQGYYDVDGVKIVPSWGGSMFEFLMPILVLKEQELAPKGMGLNNEHVVDLHIRHALKKKKYLAWGMSPCSTPDGSNGGYAEFGVSSAGTKGYPDKGVITPYATFLALDIRPDEAVLNLKSLLKNFSMYGEYGFYDAVNVLTGDVAYRYMSLDQGMSLVAMNNYLNNGIIRERFHKDPYIKNVEDLLSMEEFFPES